MMTSAVFKLAAALLATVASASPIEKRAVEWVYVTDTVTDYVDLTTTIWLDSTPATSATSTPKPNTLTSIVHLTSILPGSPAAFYSLSTTQSTPSVTSTVIPAVPVAPTTTSSVTTTPPAVAAVAPVVTTSTPAAAPVVSTPSPPAPSVSAVVSNASPASANGPFSGDMTYYETGLGACGWTNVDTDMIIAMPFEMMGTLSNSNPYCGRTISITANGVTATATVADKCMGCVGYSIDMSPSLFQKFYPLGDGRKTCTWEFTD
jgi:hypothetical protein